MSKNTHLGDLVRVTLMFVSEDRVHGSCFVKHVVAKPINWLQQHTSSLKSGGSNCHSAWLETENGIQYARVDDVFCTKFRMQADPRRIPKEELERGQTGRLFKAPNVIDQIHEGSFLRQFQTLLIRNAALLVLQQQQGQLKGTPLELAVNRNHLVSKTSKGSDAHSNGMSPSTKPRRNSERAKKKVSAFWCKKQKKQAVVSTTACTCIVILWTT